MNNKLLHSASHGDGPVVVLLHGFLSSSDYWQNVTPLLEQHHRVITLDLLGFGRSPKPHKGKYDYDEHLDAVQRTLDHHNVGEPFTLVGHSMGSLIALRYANVYVDNVDKLVLVNVPAVLDVAELKREILGSSIVNRWGLGRARTRFTWTIARLLYRLRWLPPWAISAIKRNNYFFHHTAASRLGSFYNILGMNHLADDLRNIAVATIVLSGSSDKKIYLHNLTEKLSLGANVVHKIIPTGHHIPRLMPERVVREIQQ